MRRGGKIQLHKDMGINTFTSAVISVLYELTQNAAIVKSRCGFGELTHGVISLGPQLNAVKCELELSIEYLFQVTGG
ncbi:hypothetical protein D3C72_2398950 [compost metagenome]